jgi:8-oxo-dGTP pyrophosphatase MutT (NUDIX family)
VALWREHVLGVSRGPGSDSFGLPGGLLERGETFKDAARRELEEETGLTCGPLVLLSFKRRNGRYVSTFYTPWVHGDIRSSSEGDAVWIDPRILAQGKHGRANMKSVDVALKIRFADEHRESA